MDSLLYRLQPMCYKMSAHFKVRLITTGPTGGVIRTHPGGLSLTAGEEEMKQRTRSTQKRMIRKDRWRGEGNDLISPPIIISIIQVI